MAHHVVDVGPDASPTGPTMRAPIINPRPANRYWRQPASVEQPAARGTAVSVTVTSLNPGWGSISPVGLEGHVQRAPRRAAERLQRSGEARLDALRHAARDPDPDGRPARVPAPIALEGTIGRAVTRDEGTRAEEERVHHVGCLGRLGFRAPRLGQPRRLGRRLAVPASREEPDGGDGGAEPAHPNAGPGHANIPPIPPHAKDHTPSPRAAVPRRRSGDAVGCWRAACTPQMDTGEGARQRRLSPRT